MSVIDTPIIFTVKCGGVFFADYKNYRHQFGKAVYIFFVGKRSKYFTADII